MSGQGGTDDPDAGAREPSGAEPVEAKPVYRARLAFAAVGLAIGVTGAVVFGLRMAEGRDAAAAVVGLAVSVLVAASAVVDIAVIVRRRGAQ